MQIVFLRARRYHWNLDRLFQEHNRHLGTFVYAIHIVCANECESFTFWMMQIELQSKSYDDFTATQRQNHGRRIIKKKCGRIDRKKREESIEKWEESKEKRDESKEKREKSKEKRTESKDKRKKIVGCHGMRMSKSNQIKTTKEITLTENNRE